MDDPTSWLFGLDGVVVLDVEGVDVEQRIVRVVVETEQRVLAEAAAAGEAEQRRTKGGLVRHTKWGLPRSGLARSGLLR